MTERDSRAARRQFIRAHHPDRGGDLDVFVTGLLRLSGQAGGVTAASPVRFYRRPRGLRRLTLPASRLLHRFTRTGPPPPPLRVR